MLCRRCGMESSTTDVCEWCKRPMLPPGAEISTEAAKQIAASGTSVGVPPQSDEDVGEGLRELRQQEEVEAPEENAASLDEAKPDVLLKPLGGDKQEEPQTPSPAGEAEAKVSGTPTHGLGEDATKTSVDISEYLTAGESIFRPIERETSQKSTSSLEQVSTKRAQARRKEDEGPTLTENERLVRSLIAGLASGIFFAILQFLITGTTVQQLYVLKLSHGSDFFAAIKFGIASGVVLGLGLGAILTKLQKGSFIGMILGMIVGMGFQNAPWGLLAGAITGIYAGKVATIGVKRVINV